MRWSLAVCTDLFEIVDFIIADRPRAARKLGREISKAAARLARSPLGDRIVPELLDQGAAAYRQILESNWRVIDEVRQDEVHIHVAVDSRRDLSDLLQRRLLR